MKALASIVSLVLLLATATLVGCARPDAGDGSRGGRTLIQNKGSDTLVNVAQAWAEAYKDVDPSVAIAVSGGGSGTGISALINGTVDLANTSRQMKDEEIELARAAGNEPVEHVVGYDALAVFLHADNPATSLSLSQLAEIYGEGGTIDTWSQLGLEVPGCSSDEIVRVSRQNNSGTYVYFQEAVLGKQRDYRLGSRDMHGSKDVVDLVEKTPCAIGYSGLAYATHGVQVVCLATEGDEDCVNASVETASDGSYPIARPLFMLTQGEPAGAVAEYLQWILSDDGQCILRDKGYAPVRDVACGGAGETADHGSADHGAEDHAAEGAVDEADAPADAAPDAAATEEAAG
ncbi:MAG: phosphate ABC transporter substrate-binding protein [Acidobacteriota bacterium]